MTKQSAADGATTGPLYGNAEGYDAYMGHWSRALAPLFLDFAAPNDSALLLDVGCGTGNLLAAARSRFPGARLVGIDPSSALLAMARARGDLQEIELVTGDAERLPFTDAHFTACLSLLVLQEFQGRLEPLLEMRRITRPDGVVAGCQWDFSKMPVIAALVEALASIEAGPREQLAINSRRHFNDEGELAEAWGSVGFHDVTTARIKVARRYANFDELWVTLLGGSTPSTMILATLPAPRRDAVQRHMQTRFDPSGRGEPLEIVAEALAVRGRA
jgi:ubiquinone/menaquinone biosynthesis C-methylase UbiE